MKSIFNFIVTPKSERYSNVKKLGDKELILNTEIFNSRSWLDENRYLVYLDQIYAYKKNDQWKAFPGYSFIKPIVNDDVYSIEKEKPLVGVVKYTDGSINEGDLVGFTPGSEYEFIVDGEKLYRVPTNKITIKYEYQGNEKEYNPSWA